MSELARRVARYRVRLGFPSAVLALWLAQPTERSLAAGAIVALVGEGLRIWAAGHLEKGREVTASGPVPLLAASALSWFDDHRRGIRDRGGECRRGMCGGCVSGDHVDRCNAGGGSAT